MIEVELTFQELTVAAMIGVFRQVSALKNGRASAHGYDESDSWTTHIEGAAAEMAIARLLDRYWAPLANGSLRDLPGDVGEGVQVRSTARRDGSLIVHPSDPAEQRFYLVISHTPPTYRIVGWLRGREAQRDEFWRESGVRNPAYFVPQSALRSCDAVADVLRELA